MTMVRTVPATAIDGAARKTHRVTWRKPPEFLEVGFYLLTVPDTIALMTTLRIANGRVIDPSQNLDRVADLWLEDGRVLGVGPQPGRAADRTLDAAGKIVSPGCIDMHVHLPAPGREEDETIATGTAAAVAGGVTSVACMPNTEPALDSQAQAEFVIHQAQRAGF